MLAPLQLDKIVRRALEGCLLVGKVQRAENCFDDLGGEKLCSRSKVDGNSGCGFDLVVGAKLAADLEGFA